MLKKIHEDCVNHFKQFQKSFVYTHTWKRKKLKNYKFLEVTNNERVGEAKLVLVESLMLFMKNDKLRGYKLIPLITDDVWDLLLIWFREAP
jgi:hypothetical protein